MSGDTSLAKLFRDHGQRWEIEKITRSSEWIAIRRDKGGLFCIVWAHDLEALRYHIEAKERQDAGGDDCQCP